MTSAVDLANRALLEAGTRTTITSFEEPSTEAAACATFYGPIRRQLLRGVHWGCAKKQLPLSLLGTLSAGTGVYPWTYKYAYPEDCLLLRYLLRTPPTGTGVIGDPGYFRPSPANRFEIANDGGVRVILSNVEFAIGVYTFDVTNVEIWDPLFEEAVVMALAAKLVIPLSGNVGMKGDFISLALTALNNARASDGNESPSDVDHTPDWIAGRNGALIPGFPEQLGIWFNTWENVSFG